MNEPRPVEKLYHPGIVVRDARATARNYAELLGITQWKVLRCAPDHHVTSSSTYGCSAPHRFVVAFGVHEASGLVFQLIQPEPGDGSTYSEFLATRGEGVHNLCTACVTPSVLDDLANWFVGTGIGVSQVTTVDDVVDWCVFDTRDALGGFSLMVLAPRVADWEDKVQFDEDWDFTDEIHRPAGVGPIPLARIPALHFGVVVRDVVARMRRYAEIMDLETVSFTDIGTSGSIPRTGVSPIMWGNATYRGKPVEHRIFNSFNIVSDFGFEVIQATVPPLHYKEEFLDVVGEGIHHFYATELHGDAEWQQLDQWMTSLEIPVAQSGEMNCGVAQGLGEYFYWDTRERLGGYVLEVILARPGFWESVAHVPPTMVLNFEPRGR